MITLLSKLFIKETNGSLKESPENYREQYGVLCGITGIVLNILLFIGKFLAGFFANSIAIMADAFNNLSDAGSSFITLAGFKLAGQKPDPDHPFGHGRFEYISGLLVSIVIILMAFELMKSSIGKIIKPEDVATSAITYIILITSILVKLYMAFYNRSVGKKISSVAMSATATDSISDCIATSVVLVCSIIAQFTNVNLDAYCGVVVAVFIFIAGFKAAKETIDPLLGTPPEKEFVDEIENIVMAHEDILGIHDLIVHNYGPGRVMISLHAEVDAHGDILILHDLIDNIEHELKTKCNCQAVIHMDPIINDDEEINHLKKDISHLIKEIDEKMTLHDFRVVKGPTHTNVIFDVVAPYNLPFKDDELKQIISAKILNKFPCHFAVIEIDRDYTKGH